MTDIPPASALPETLDELERVKLEDAALMLAPFIDRHDPILAAKLYYPKNYTDQELIGQVLAAYDLLKPIFTASFDLVRQQVQMIVETWRTVADGIGIDINADMLEESEGYDHDE